MQHLNRLVKPLISSLTLSFLVSVAHASIDSQLSLIDTKLAPANFHPLGNDNLQGMLGEFEEEAQLLTLTKGDSYSLIAVCEEDCTDLDLYVLDNNDAVIGHDDDDHSVAVVDFTAGYTGTYKAEVTMYDCAKSKCDYTVKSYIFKQ